jgi:hypothetical protein
MGCCAVPRGAQWVAHFHHSTPGMQLPQFSIVDLVSTVMCSCAKLCRGKQTSAEPHGISSCICLVAIPWDSLLTTVRILAYLLIWTMTHWLTMLYSGLLYQTFSSCRSGCRPDSVLNPLEVKLHACGSKSVRQPLIVCSSCVALMAPT